MWEVFIRPPTTGIQTFSAETCLYGLLPPALEGLPPGRSPLGRWLARRESVLGISVELGRCEDVPDNTSHYTPDETNRFEAIWQELPTELQETYAGRSGTVSNRHRGERDRFSTTMPRTESWAGRYSKR